MRYFLFGPFEWAWRSLTYWKRQPFVKLALANDFTKAAKLHRRLYPAFKTLFIEPNPVPVKYALKRAGIIASDEVRSPLCGMSAANTGALEGVLAQLD